MIKFKIKIKKLVFEKIFFFFYSSELRIMNASLSYLTSDLTGVSK